MSRHSTVGGPSGAGWKSIECLGTQDECFRHAAATCPEGYELASSGGASDVSGGRDSVSSTYHGHMLIKCTRNDTSPWKKIEGSGYAFMVPNSWITMEVEGTTVFRPSDSLSFQVAMDITKTIKTLPAYVADEYIGYAVEQTDVDGRAAILASRRDETNGVRVATMTVKERGNIYALTCASTPMDVLSPTCRRVLFSLRVDD